jgi:geranylgeranyl diphosphate synthase, type II
MIPNNQYEQAISKAIAELSFPARPAELYDPIRYTLEKGGKRLRPQLVLMACELVSGKFDNAVMPALGIETFHNFTLLHDDIMDNAPLRRGHDTVHVKWNSNIAILSGDVMFVEACRLMTEAPIASLQKVLSVFYKAAIEVCEGQQYDMNFESRDEVQIDEYIEMIRLKTAVLLGASMQIGALCGSAQEKDAELLYDFGCHLGIAFQLMDDILDVYGDPLKFGKQVGGDILANKKTYMSIRAFEKAQGDVKTSLERWFETRQPSLAKVEQVTELFNTLGVKQDAEAEMEKHYAAAINALDKLDCPKKSKLIVYAFAENLMQREK